MQRRGADECWLWTGATSGRAGYADGGAYGYFRDGDGRTVRAHRFAYELLVGAIPDGLVIDHLCRKARCVNPGHMEVVTQAENMRRSLIFPSVAARHAAQTECANGHEYTAENTYTSPGGVRSCRRCHRERERERRANRRKSLQIV